MTTGSTSGGRQLAQLSGASSSALASRSSVRLYKDTDPLLRLPLAAARDLGSDRERDAFRTISARVLGTRALPKGRGTSGAGGAYAFDARADAERRAEERAVSSRLRARAAHLESSPKATGDGGGGGGGGGLRNGHGVRHGGLGSAIARSPAGGRGHPPASAHALGGESTLRARATLSSAAAASGSAAAAPPPPPPPLSLASIELATSLYRADMDARAAAAVQLRAEKRALFHESRRLRALLAVERTRAAVSRLDLSRPPPPPRRLVGAEHGSPGSPGSGAGSPGEDRALGAARDAPWARAGATTALPPLGGAGARPADAAGGGRHRQTRADRPSTLQWAAGEGLPTAEWSAGDEAAPRFSKSRSSLYPHAEASAVADAEADEDDEAGDEAALAVQRQAARPPSRGGASRAGVQAALGTTAEVEAADAHARARAGADTDAGANADADNYADDGDAEYEEEEDEAEEERSERVEPVEVGVNGRRQSLDAAMHENTVSGEWRGDDTYSEDDYNDDD